MTFTFDQPWLAYTHYVYELYGEDGTCLYIGCTWRLGGRLQTHGTKPWWPAVIHIEVNAYPNQDAGRQVERERIRLLNPVRNRVFTDHPAAYAWARRRARESSETATSVSGSP